MSGDTRQGGAGNLVILGSRLEEIGEAKTNSKPIFAM